MNIKQKIKSTIGKLRRKAKNIKRDPNSELAAEEVIEQEIFPEPKKSTRKCCASKKTPATASKKPSKRTRPTNPGYTMIDPSNDTVDGGKS